MKMTLSTTTLGTLLAVGLSLPQLSHGATQYHRVAWDSDPSSNAVIGFSPNGASNSPYVKYGYSTDESQWSTQSAVETRGFGSLTNHFVRLSGLNADSAVYYRVCDQDGCGQRFWFKTAPTDTTPFIAVAGGDTRTGWDTRRAGNTLISKLRPLFVMHGGDFTDANSSSQMMQYLEDWALTYSSDSIDGYSYKRIYPVVPTHGNHEDGNYSTLCQVFGVDYDQDGVCSDNDTYGAFNVSPLLRVYTLNSQYKNSGWSAYAAAMNDWLSGDLSSYGGSATWRFAQYHKPIFPHYSGKSENQILHDWWANDFYDYAMNLVVESDTHMAKVTQALYPSGSGFAETTTGGTVFVGEGSWGAPARSADDPKSWTIDLASIQQFKVLTVSADKVEVRTAQFDSSASTLSREQRAADPTLLPTNVDWWHANGIGEAMILVQSAQNRTVIDSGSGGGGGTSVTLNASEDTFVSSALSGTNFDGSAEQLLADGSDSTYGEMTSLIKFDVSSIQPCATVTAATLRLNVFNSSGGTYGVYAAAGSWSAASATWNSVGGAGAKGAQLAAFNPSSTGVMSVTLGSSGLNAVNGWVQGGNDGIVIASTGTTDGIDMSDMESGAGAVLQVGVDDSGCGGVGNVAPVAAFSASANGLTATFSDDSTDSDGTIAYRSWNFGDGATSTAHDPSHTYAAAGTYMVTLTVTDNAGATDSRSETVTVSASAGGGSNVIDVRVSQSTDDAEEAVANGSMYTNSSDLEMVYDSYVGGDQAIGIRFQSVNIPQGAVINAAYLRFATDETDSAATALTIHAQDSDSADTFTTAYYDVSSRPTTLASVSWSPAAWSTIGAVNDTPDLAALVQEVVNRAGWAANNSMAFIVTGSGQRTAESYDGSPATAPLLHVEYTAQTTTNPVPPRAAFSVATSDLTATFTDNSTDSDGTIAAWSWNFGDGVTSSAEDPSHSYLAAGTYTVTLTVTDNDGLTDSASQSVTVTEALTGSDDLCPGIDLGNVSSTSVPSGFSDSIQRDTDDWDIFSITATENGVLTLVQSPGGRWVSFSVGTACGVDDLYTRVNSNKTKTATVNVSAGDTIYFWMDTTGYRNTRERPYSLSFDFN